MSTSRIVDTTDHSANKHSRHTLSRRPEIHAYYTGSPSAVSPTGLIFDHQQHSLLVNFQNANTPYNGQIDKFDDKTGELAGVFNGSSPDSSAHLNLAGQMFRVVRRDATEFIQQALGNHLGLDMFHPVDDAMPDGSERNQCTLLVKPTEKKIGH